MDAQIKREVKTPVATEIELHLSNHQFPMRFGKRVKRLGGRYSACRGDQTKRFVHLAPATEGVADLVDTLIKDNGKTVVCLRGGRDFFNLPSNLVVMHVPETAESPSKFIEDTFDKRFQNYFRTYPAHLILYLQALDQSVSLPAPEDPNAVLATIKDTIAEFIKSSFPAFVPDTWGTLAFEKASKGPPSDYLVAGNGDQQGMRLCFLVTVHRPFPKTPDVVDVIHLDRCERMFTAPMMTRS